MTTLEQLHPIKYEYISFNQQFLYRLNHFIKRSKSCRFLIYLYLPSNKCCVGLFFQKCSTLICQGLLSFDLLPPRLSLVLLALIGETASFLASIWAVQTPSWWLDRLLSTCGRSWCPTPPELFERSSQPSSLSCWVSWLPPALTNERYYSFSLHTQMFLFSLVGDCHYLRFSVSVKLSTQGLFTDTVCPCGYRLRLGRWVTS